MVLSRRVFYRTNHESAGLSDKKATKYTVFTFELHFIRMNYPNSAWVILEEGGSQKGGGFLRITGY